MTGSNDAAEPGGNEHDWRKLQEILVQQYLLHEVQHQPALHGRGHGPAAHVDSSPPESKPTITQKTPPERTDEGDRRPSDTAPAARRPLSQEPKTHGLIDIYKCLHQGEFGVGHSIDNPVRFKERLEQEVLTNPPIDDEPLVEIISMDGKVARLNLRPFRKRFADDITRAVKGLSDICLESAHRRRGEPGYFLKTLYAFRDLNAGGKLAVGNIAYMFDPRSVDQFLVEVRNLARQMRQIPVFGHSPTYRQQNAPAYRVIDLELLRCSPLAEFLQI